MAKILVAAISLFSVMAFVSRHRALDGQELKSKDGAIQISVPHGWQSWEMAGSVGKIQARSAETNAYLTVVSEEKSDFDYQTLNEYVKLILEIEAKNNKVGDRTISEPKKLKINGLDAIQYEVRGTVKNVKLVYHKTFIDSPTRWNQILCWTTPSHFEGARKDFDAIDQSFKENAHPTGK